MSQHQIDIAAFRFYMQPAIQTVFGDPTFSSSTVDQKIAQCSQIALAALAAERELAQTGEVSFPNQRKAQQPTAMSMSRGPIQVSVSKGPKSAIPQTAHAVPMQRQPVGTQAVQSFAPFQQGAPFAGQAKVQVIPKDG